MKSFFCWLSLACLLTAYCVSGEQFDKETCQACHRISSSIDHIYQNLTATQQLEYILTKFCTSGYDGRNEYVCKQIVKTFVPIFKRIGSEDFCSSIKACPPNQLDLDLDFHIDNSSCVFCLDVIKESKADIENPKNVDQIKQLGNKFCQMLPTLKEECFTLFRNELAHILALLDQTNAFTTCSSLHLCTNKTSNLIPKPTPAPKRTSVVLAPTTALQSLSLKCVICDDVVGFAFKVLQQNSTEEAIARALSSVCSVFYRHNKLKHDNCASMVEKYAEQFINLLINQIHPDTVCALLRCCDNPSSLKLSVIHAPNSLPAEPSSQRKPPSQLQVKVQPTCMVCSIVFKYVYRRINGTETTEELENILDQSCDVLFKKWSHRPDSFNKCEKFVAANADALVRLIKSNAGPELTCMAIGLCAPIDKVLKVEFLQPENQIKLASSSINSNKKASSAECFMCKKVVTAIYKHLTTNKSETQIIENLDRICTRLFANPTSCENYVQQYAPRLIQLILHYDSPEKVCQALNECPTDMFLNLSPIPIYNHLSTSFEKGSCDICKAVVGIVYKDLKDNATQKAITNAAEKICVYFATMKDCKQVIDGYVREIINAIENSTNPAEACSYLGYCKANESSVIELTSVSLPEFKAPAKEPADSEICEQCLKAVEPIHKWAANPTCKKQVFEDIAKACQQCKAKEKCIATLSSYAKTLFHDADKYTQPRRVCSTLGVCKQNQRQLQLEALRNAVNSLLPKDEITISHLGNKSFCYECQMLTNFVQGLLYKPEIEDAIIASIKQNFCQPITSHLERKACNDYFDRYGRQMIQHFAAEALNQKTVCVERLRLCPSA